MPPTTVHTFTSIISRFPGEAKYHYLEIPSELAEVLLQEESRRILVTIFEKTYRRAILSKKEGFKYVFVGKDMMRELGVMLGALVDVSIEMDPNPDDLDIPEEFLAVLDQDKDAAERFFGFTPGVRRSLAHYVRSAKREETRIKRSLDLAKKLRTYTLYSDLNADKV